MGPRVEVGWVEVGWVEVGWVEVDRVGVGWVKGGGGKQAEAKAAPPSRSSRVAAAEVGIALKLAVPDPGSSNLTRRLHGAGMEQWDQRDQ
jgi:hypothetical protein